jgi:hypothetical protein
MEKTNKEERYIGICTLILIIVLLTIILIAIAYIGETNEDYILHTEKNWQYEGILKDCYMDGNDSIFITLENTTKLFFVGFNESELEILKSFTNKEIRIKSYSIGNFEVIDGFYRVVRIKEITNVRIREV